MTPLFICLAAYLLGSIPFGLILTRVAGLGDIRDIGSGNIGATNVLRTGKKSLAAITLLLDALKGTVAVLLALVVTMGDPAPTSPAYGQEAAYIAWYASLAGMFALVGHMYPLWLRFKGGKGVATALGIWLALSPLVFAGILVAWLGGAYASKISSFGALLAMALLPVLSYFIAPQYFVAALLTMALVVWRHRGNVSRLLAGTEPRIGAKA